MAIKSSDSFYSNFLEENNYKEEINKSFNLVREMEREVEKYNKLLNLALEDRIRVVKSLVDYMKFDIIIPSAKKWHNMINNEAEKIDKRKKYSEKDMYGCLIAYLKEDFFGGREVEIVEFVQGGYEGYYNAITIKCCNIIFVLEVPCLSKLNIKNFEYANYGMLSLYIKSSISSRTNIVRSYEEIEIKNAIDKEILKNMLTNE